jgi:hypothetical protein
MPPLTQQFPTVQTQFGPVNTAMLADPANIRGIPLIHTACIDGNLKQVEQLLAQRPEDLECQDIVGSRPLHVASCYGHVHVMKHLIACGADINARDNYNSTPLVVVSSSTEALELLVSMGADIDAKNANNISARTQSNNPYTALAIEQGLKQLERRRKLTKQYIIDATDPNRNEENGEATLQALSALTTLSTPTFSPSVAPHPALSPLVGPLSLSPSMVPRGRVGGGGAGGAGGAAAAAAASMPSHALDADEAERPASASGRMPGSVASLIVAYLYPPPAAAPKAAPYSPAPSASPAGATALPPPGRFKI